MKQHISPHDYIAAAERLYQYSANKRFKVTNNSFIDDKIGQIARYINSLISVNSGLDVFSTDNPNALLDYEGALSHEVSSFTETEIVNRDVSDEVDVLLTYYNVDTNEFADRAIIISQASEVMTNMLPISSEDLLAACATPTSAMKSPRHQPDSHHNYLCATEITVGEDKYHLSYHLSSNSEDNAELELHATFLVADDIYFIHLNNPANLFLECIDKYGLMLKIGDQIKRIYSYRKISIEHPVRLEELNNVIQPILEPEDREFLLYAPIKIDGQDPHILYLEFVYGVSVTRFQASLEAFNVDAK